VTSDQATLIAAILAAVAAIASIFVNSIIAYRYEKRKVLWGKEVERFFKLEELAGQLIEELGSYRPIPQDRSELVGMFRELELSAGRFARYPEVRQAARDLHNVISRMFAAKRDREDDREVRLELEPAFRKLLAACDAIVGRREP
jgi:hypothetical protein